MDTLPPTLRGNWWQALKCLIVLELRQDIAGANGPCERQLVTGYTAFFPSLSLTHLQVHEVKNACPQFGVPEGTLINLNYQDS